MHTVWVRACARARARVCVYTVSLGLGTAVHQARPGTGPLDLIDADCNGNALPDECDLEQGLSFDCNSNGILDECDIDNGTSLDCNGNGRPDVCDVVMGQPLIDPGIGYWRFDGDTINLGHAGILQRRHYCTCCASGT